jgi:hypothetical protein
MSSSITRAHVQVGRLRVGAGVLETSDSAIDRTWRMLCRAAVLLLALNYTVSLPRAYVYFMVG